MKILMFGGTGFVSGRLLYCAANKGHEVIYITRGITPINYKIPATHIGADRNENDLENKLKGFEWDVVVDVICRTPSQVKQSIELSLNCRRLLMVSTDYVYNPLKRKLPQNEEDAIFTKENNYGGNKRKAELEITKASESGIIDSTILRPPHIYGAGSNPGTIPDHGRKAELFNDIRNDVTLRLIEGGLGLIQPLYYDDLARILLEIIPKKKTYGEIYNCPGNKLMTHVDYYREIGKCLGKKVSIKAYYPDDEDNINPFPMGHRYYDNTKLRKILENFRYTSFEEGIAKWVESFEKYS